MPFNPKKLIETVALVAKIEVRRAEALAAVEAARRELGLAILASETGSKKPDAQNARKALKIAEDAFSEVEIVLDAVRCRHKADLSARAEAEAKKRWVEVRKLSRCRSALAMEIERLIRSLSEKVSELEVKSQELFETAPSQPTSFSQSEFAPQHISTALRQHFVKMGFSWACRFPWSLDTIPTLVQRITQGNDALIQLSEEKNQGNQETKR